MFNISESWKSAFPNAHTGLLVLRAASNPPVHPELESRKQALQDQLRAHFAGGDRKAIEALTPIQAYNAYYKRFKKTYHVQAQLESVVFKGRDIPSVAALVEAMFMAEIKNLLLTAGHDLDKLQLPVTLSVANGSEHYILFRGQEQTLKAGDMMMADERGVISSILYGPDRRTQITGDTQNVLFAVYAPAGISGQAVYDHLGDIRDNVLIVSPEAQVQTLQVFGAHTLHK